MPDKDKLIPLFQELEFKKLLQKYAPESVPIKMTAAKTKKDGAVKIVKRKEDLEKALQNISTKQIAVLVVGQDADLFGNKISATALSDGKTAVVMLNASPAMLAAVGVFLAHADEVVVHDFKKLLHLTGWTIAKSFDLMIASYLLNSGSREHDLPSFVAELIKKNLPAVPEKALGEKDLSVLGEIVLQCPVLAQAARQKMQENGVEKIFDQIETPLSPILYAMEKAGILLDTKALGLLSKKLKKFIEDLEKKIIELSGETFNPN